MQRDKVVERENTIGGFIEDEPADIEGALQEEVEDLAAAIIIHGKHGDNPQAMVSQAFDLAEEFIVERERRRNLNQGTL